MSLSSQGLRFETQRLDGLSSLHQNNQIQVSGLVKV
jgi:hypothetical protein